MVSHNSVGIRRWYVAVAFHGYQRRHRCPSAIPSSGRLSIPAPWPGTSTPMAMACTCTSHLQGNTGDLTTVFPASRRHWRWVSILPSHCPPRGRNAKPRALLAAGTDPSAAKQEEKRLAARASVDTFQAVGREWLAKSSARRGETTQAWVISWLEKNIFPAIGHIPIADLRARDVLDAVRIIEQRGAIDSAKRVLATAGRSSSMRSPPTPSPST
jgi:hypothetical protein